MFFFIFDQYITYFSLKLKTAAENKGFRTVILTCHEIVKNLGIDFYLVGNDTKTIFNYMGTTIESHDIAGVYSGINSFDPTMWPWFSKQDAEYAAKETQALWLAILSSLPCRVINQPALDTLAGTYLSTPEIFFLAHQIGFKIPTVITLESGKQAAELLEHRVQASYADLGETWINEKDINQANAVTLIQNKNHFRVKENIRGTPIYATLLGNKFFTCTLDQEGSLSAIPDSEIPKQVKKWLSILHKKLNLDLAEYMFRVTEEKTWVFTGYNRPPQFSYIVYGETLLDCIIDYTAEKRI
ncbi:hypothetical protein MUO71_04360 [Candidatus Bathyarchaeota archaeon]|nr:hypothetical protein [Candidatus Bathyarchaeota archaeon]